MTTILAELRALVPRRPLSREEAYRIAEQQAQRLLKYFEIQDGPVPEMIVSDIPRIVVERMSGMPVSGASKWSGGRWLILINDDEPLVRQRFSLAHELLHVINHPYNDFLYPFSRKEDAFLATEQIADYFAACLLMPKMWVKRACYKETQNSRALAQRFGVSQAAMKYRLTSLGIIEPVQQRCAERARHTSVRG